MKKKQRLQTPSQTVGPYFAYGLTPEQYHYDFPSSVTPRAVFGDDQIAIQGRVFDGNGAVIPDAMIELWSHDGKNRILARAGTGADPQAMFHFTVTKPEKKKAQAPYFTVIVFMRGQLLHSYSRLYFSDETEANEGDEVLQSVPETRRKTLIASKDSRSGDYHFDIHMQGANETVFFDL